jgi:dihydrofolate reductase
MKTIIIAAVAKNGVIGNGGDLPWHLPEDFAHFKETTRGFPVIMGRLTFESMNNRPLPKRVNIILSGKMTQPKDAELLRRAQHGTGITVMCEGWL